MHSTRSILAIPGHAIANASQRKCLQLVLHDFLNRLHFCIRLVRSPMHSCKSQGTMKRAARTTETKDEIAKRFLERFERNKARGSANLRAILVKPICRKDAVTKIQFVARVGLGAALSLATHRKAQRQLPPARSLAYSLSRGHDILRISRVDHAKGFGRWQLTLQMGYTCPPLFAVSFRASFYVKSGTRLIAAAQKPRDSINFIDFCYARKSAP